MGGGKQEERTGSGGSTIPRGTKPHSVSGLADATYTPFEGSEERLKFLVKASQILASSLEYEETLRAVADLLVPHLADWCTVHIRERDGSIGLLTVSHADPRMVEYAESLTKKYPPKYDESRGVGRILQGGDAEIIPVITDDMLVSGSIDEEHLSIMRSLRLSSYICVPMAARGGIVGAISLFMTDGRHYADEDLLFARSLGSRAALAVDNARLFAEAQEMNREVQELNRELERKVAERTRELHDAREKDRSNLHRLKSMLSSLPMAALMTDEHGNLLELNEEYCLTFNIGLSAREAMAIDPQDLTRRFQKSLLHADLHMANVNAMLAARQPVLGRDILLKDGRIVQRDYLPIYDEGKYLGQLFLYRDVTRERRIDASKSEFMSLASHQLRTPLTSMRWAMSMLHRSMEDRATEFETKLLKEAKDGAGRMSQTIDTMLHISRLESGEVAIQTAEIHLAPFVREMINYEGREFTQKHHAVRFHCPEDLKISTDPSLLKEIIGNLLSNAYKYTPENGEIRLEIHKKGSTVQCDIADSGYGIPAHQQAHIFKKFFRGDNVVDKVTDGTGLGLYLASLLTNLLGGSIGCVSREGEGTAFQLRLPCHGRVEG